MKVDFLVRLHLALAGPLSIKIVAECMWSIKPDVLA